MFIFKDYAQFANVSDSLSKFKKSILVDNQNRNGSKFKTLFEIYSEFDDNYYENQISKIQKDAKNLDENLILSDLNGESCISFKVTDEVLSKILNSERQVLIGNIVYKFDYNFIETLDLFTNKTENLKISRNSGSSSKKGKVMMNTYAESNYSYSGRNYKVVLENEYYTWCYAVTNGDLTNGSLTACHYKRFLGIWYTNQTNFVRIAGSANAGYPNGINYNNNCYGCGVNYGTISKDESCTGCSSKVIDFGGSGCFNSFNGINAAFNCDDGQARQLYL